MANQAIALQARAPQGNFLAPAIQQGAQFINMMSQQRAAERQAAAQQQQLEIARAAEGRAVAGEARAAELHPFAVTKAQADAMTADQKAVIGFYDLTNEGLKRASTPEQAMVVADYLKQKFPGAAPAVDQTISTLPSDPGQFEAWRRQTLFKSMTAQQQLAKKFIEQNTGTGTRQLEVSEYEPGAAAQELPGSRIETGQEITYVKGPNNEVIPMPKRMGRPPASGGGVQFGVPVQGTTGGKVDQQKLIKATTAAEAASARYDRTIDAAQKLLKSPALDSIVGNFQGNIPETALGMMSQGAANALALLNTLIARGGFAELQAMRDASPTGGALGQVSDRENTMLQNAAATLIRSQDEASFRENLKAYIAELTNSKERVQSAWQQQFGRPFPSSKLAPTAKAPGGSTRPPLASFRG